MQAPDDKLVLRAEDDAAPHEPPRYMKIPVEILVFLCLLVGIVPAYTVAPLLAAAAASTLGGELPEYSLAIWHGLNAPMMVKALQSSPHADDLVKFTQSVKTAAINGILDITTPPDESC